MVPHLPFNWPRLAWSLASLSLSRCPASLSVFLLSTWPTYFAPSNNIIFWPTHIFRRVSCFHFVWAAHICVCVNISIDHHCRQVPFRPDTHISTTFFVRKTGAIAAGRCTVDCTCRFLFVVAFFQSLQLILRVGDRTWWSAKIRTSTDPGRLFHCDGNRLYALNSSFTNSTQGRSLAAKFFPKSNLISN